MTDSSTQSELLLRDALRDVHEGVFQTLSLTVKLDYRMASGDQILQQSLLIFVVTFEIENRSSPRTLHQIDQWLFEQPLFETEHPGLSVIAGSNPNLQRTRSGQLSAAAMLLSLDFVDGSVRQNLTGFDDRCRITNLTQFGQNVLTDQNSLLHLCGQQTNQFSKFHSRTRIQTSCRFVENHDLWIVDQASPKPQSL